MRNIFTDSRSRHVRIRLEGQSMGRDGGGRLYRLRKYGKRLLRIKHKQSLYLYNILGLYEENSYFIKLYYAENHL